MSASFEQAVKRPSIDTHDHLLRTGLTELTDPSSLRPSPLRAAARAYQAAFNDLASYAHLAA